MKQMFPYTNEMRVLPAELQSQLAEDQGCWLKFTDSFNVQVESQVIQDNQELQLETQEGSVQSHSTSVQSNSDGSVCISLQSRHAAASKFLLFTGKFLFSECLFGMQKSFLKYLGIQIK
ncbi:hypothetical protein ACTFIV_007904 [Dictyostelium citrinum]